MQLRSDATRRCPGQVDGAPAVFVLGFQVGPSINQEIDDRPAHALAHGPVQGRRLHLHGLLGVDVSPGLEEDADDGAILIVCAAGCEVQGREALRPRAGSLLTPVQVFTRASASSLERCFTMAKMRLA